MRRWLFKVEPLGRSLSFYVPVALLEKALTYGRVLLLTWLLGAYQFGIWGLGMMIFGVLAPVATLGANEALARYVSFYQARGQLAPFLRRAAAGILLIAVAVGVLALLGRAQVAALLSTVSDTGRRLGGRGRLEVAVLGVVNGVLMALYLNVQFCLRALRTFRLLAVVELAYTVGFTALALAAAVAVPAGRCVLLAHAAVLAAMVLAGSWAVRAYVRRHPAGDDEAGAAAAGRPGAEVAEGLAATLSRLLRFGLVAMLVPVVWNLGNQVSVWFVNRYHGPEAAGLYVPFRQLCQPVWVLAGILWALVFSYAARGWEADRRDAAAEMVSLTFRAAAVALMTVTVLMLSTARLWSLLLPRVYREQLAVLPGLLMFFQSSANLGMAWMAARLRERPAVMVAIVVTGVAANAVLAALWVPGGGVVGGAWAAGVGMLCACVLAALYLAGSRFCLHPATHVLILSPALLLLPTGLVAGGWAFFLVVAGLSPWVFSRAEKRALWAYLGGLGRRRWD